MKKPNIIDDIVALKTLEKWKKRYDVETFEQAIDHAEREIGYWKAMAEELEDALHNKN